MLLAGLCLLPSNLHPTLYGQTTPPSAPVLSINRLADQQIQLELAGEELTQFLIQRSLNLPNWETLSRPPLDSSPYAVTVAPTFARQFFRAAFQPPQTPLTLELDTQNQATAWMLPEGGVLEAEAADGTRFRLTLPERALLSPVQVTLTPIASVEHLPFSGQRLGGVDLQPAGLRLLHPATLEVFPSANHEPAQAAGFAHTAQGMNLHLVPLVRSPGPLSFVLSRFSAYGAAIAGTGEREALPPPGCAAELALREISFLYDALASRRTAGAPLPAPASGELAEIEPVFSAWFAASVLPWAAQARNDGHILSLAAREFLLWRTHLLALFSEAHPFNPQISEASGLLRAGYLNALELSGERCRNEPSPRATQRMLAWAAEYILAFESDPAAGLELMQRVAACSRLELSFESSFFQDFSPGNPVRNELLVIADVPLRLEPSAFPAFSGAGTTEYVYFHHDVNECAPDGGWLEASSILSDGAFRAQVHLNLNLITGAGEGADLAPCAMVPPDLEPIQFILIMDPGAPGEVIEWTCFNNLGEVYQTGVEPPGSLWRSYFDAGHGPERLAPVGTLEAFFIPIPGSAPDAAVIAEKTYEEVLNLLGVPVIEDTYIRIRQAPTP